MCHHLMPAVSTDATGSLTTALEAIVDVLDTQSARALPPPVLSLRRTLHTCLASRAARSDIELADEVVDRLADIVTEVRLARSGDLFTRGVVLEPSSLTRS